MTTLPKTWARPLRRGIGALAVTLAAGGGALVLAPSLAHASVAPHATSYTFTTLDDQADPTFNQLLGINSKDVISGYFGSGAPGHPNKGYLLDRLTRSRITSTRTSRLHADPGHRAQQPRIVEWNGVFASYTDPSSPKTAGSVNQLPGINGKGIAVGFYNDAAGNTDGMLATP